MRADDKIGGKNSDKAKTVINCTGVRGRHNENGRAGKIREVRPNRDYLVVDASFLEKIHLRFPRLPTAESVRVP
ncbi:MAG: hypothetical protein ACLUKN_03745 [Bacilli bacterium]